MTTHDKRWGHIKLIQILIPFGFPAFVIPDFQSSGHNVMHCCNVVFLDILMQLFFVQIANLICYLILLSIVHTDVMKAINAVY